MKAVLFDAADTLFRLTKGVGWHYARVAEKHGGYLPAEVLERRFRTVWSVMKAAPESPGAREDDDKAWWLSLLVRVFSDAPPTFDLGAFFPDIWEEFARPNVWEVFPETVEVLQALSARVRLGVVSNFDSRLHLILAHLNLANYFEHVVISSEVGADKPAPRIFAHAIQRFDLQPRDIVFAGDDPDADWFGAERAGMSVFRLHRPENDLRGLLTNLCGFFGRT